MKNPTGKIDSVKTLDLVRQKYASVAAFCRSVPIHPRLFYKALAQGLGNCRSRSISRTTIERLKTEGLLVTANETKVESNKQD